MKTFADLKRRLTPGVTVTMTKFVVGGVERPGPLVGLPRKVKLVQTNAIQFEPHKEGSDGSWLYWPKAKDVTIESADSFVIAGEGPALHYTITE